MKKSQKKWPRIDQHLLDALAGKISSELGLAFSAKPDELNKILVKYFGEYHIEKLTQKVKNLLKENLSAKVELIDLLTIPETYFFRHYHLFKALEKTILPEIFRQKAESNETFTIWSAGCSSGEEPYSLAMLIDQMLEKADFDLKVRILGTDINRLKLERARQGIYSNWSFRKMPVKFLEKYFTPLDEQSFKIDAKIRRMVHFQQHNLNKGPFPPDSNWAQFDLIICRNVLIYFNKKNMFQVLHHFSEVLKDEGIFISGPAEMPSLHFKTFKPQLINDIIIYRKQEMRSSKKADRPRVSEAPIKRKEVKIIHPQRNGLAVKTKTKRIQPVKSPAGNGSLTELDLIRKLADGGKLDEARELVLNYLERNNLDFEAYYLLATIELELGKLKESEKWFRKTLFLKPDHIMANFHLANLYTLNGHHKDSRIYFNNVLKIIDNFKQHDEIPEGDGLNVSQFRQMIQKILNTNQIAG